MSPVELRVGSTGAGAFVGCGAGLGVLAPLSLGSVPVLGQLVASLSTSLGSLNHATGGAATAARRHVRGLGARVGVPGADLGFGCGVMVGYGYGAGLFLKPTALQSLSQGLQGAGQRLVAALPPPLQAAVQQRRQQHAAAAEGLAGSPALQQQQQQQQLGLMQPGAPPDLHPPASSNQLAAAAAASASQQQLEAELGELSRLAVKQQNELWDLRQQVAVLQAAVCKVDPAAPGCKAKR